VKIQGDTIDRASLSKRPVPVNRGKPIEIEWVHPDAIRPNPNNPRKHSRQQIRKLERDIRKNGCINPILITQDGEVMAGHARLEASKLAGLTEVPVIRLSFTKAQAMARNIWDNKSSDLSQFDHGLLGLAMKELTDLDFNIEDTGFSVGDPLYADVTIRRWQRHTGDDAVHAISGRRFDEMEEPKPGNAVASRKASRNHRTVRKSKGREVAANLKSARTVTVAEVPPKIRRTK
jgi:hypothetical protein